MDLEIKVKQVQAYWNFKRHGTDLARLTANLGRQKSSNIYVRGVAIVGAGGRTGKFIAEALIEQGRFRVTAITRPESTNVMPAGLHDIRKADYKDHNALVRALNCQKVLIITMNNFAPPESQTQLIDAAVEARVRWIIPKGLWIDLSNGSLARDTLLGDRLLGIRSLAGSEARYGFDSDGKKVTLFDDGRTKISHTTFAQLSRAVARLLSLKVYTEDASNNTTHLAQFSNDAVHVSFFF